MQVFRGAAAALVELGVGHVFTFLSRDIATLVAELSVLGARVHSSRHEHAAVGMADGFARAGGGLGVAIVGQGVGLTNAINSLVTAVRAHTPLLVLVGEVPGARTAAGAFQRKHLDQRALLDILRVRHVDLDDPGTALADLRAAAAMTAHGPVVVSLPEEVLEAEAGGGAARVPLPPIAVRPEPAALARMVDLLRGTPGGRTVILAGRGAVRSGAREVLGKLAARTGAVVGTSVHARGFFRGDPYDIGIIGGLAHPVARELLAEAEVVLAFGASLSYDQTVDGTVFGGARIVQIDHLAERLERYGPVELAVTADVAASARAILERLGAAASGRRGYRTPEVAGRLAGFRIEETFEDRSGPEGLDMRALTVALDRVLPRERTVVVDGGSCKYYPIAYLPSPDARAFVWPTEYGAIGISVGPAIGAAIARPDRVTVLCAGDGGLLMTLADLDAASRENLPLVVVVYDNGGLVAEVNYLLERGYTGDVARYANPQLAEVAVGLGFDALTITDLAQVPDLADRFPLRRPLLLHCRVLSAKLRPDYVSHARRRALAASGGSPG